MNTSVVELDGSEGGGQILRSALSLSMITGRPLQIRNIRGRRSRSGLLRQHLTAVQAAAQVCGAETSGAELGSRSLSFKPGKLRGGDCQFAIGTAGSTVLVLQTLLPALLLADQPSCVTISGGTHNPLAPPADFIQRSWLPLLRQMGAKVELEILRHGFMPAGGGQLRLRVEPSQLLPLQLDSPGAELGRSAQVLLAALPQKIAELELQALSQYPGWQTIQTHSLSLPNDQGPGNALLLEVTCERLTLLFSAIGQVGIRAAEVAAQAVKQAENWLRSGSAVDEHLADQLLLPMALAGGGSFTTPVLSDHLLSNRQVIQAFLPVHIDCQCLTEQRQRISISHL